MRVHKYEVAMVLRKKWIIGGKRDAYEVSTILTENGELARNKLDMKNSAA